MMAKVSVLDEILQRKRLRIKCAQEAVSLSELSERAHALRNGAKPFALRAAVTARKGDLAIIAEFKRASPSKGDLRREADAATFARTLQQNGAAAISVLTEEDFFAGSLEDLITVKAAVSIPVLRKDFMIDEYQVFESAAAGADAVLLIVAALADQQLSSLRQLTENELAMDALVEVHTADEMKRAISCGASLVGVNNRDLRTLAVSLDAAEHISALAPADMILICESGLNSHSDLQRFGKAGFHGFLIGEALMKADDPGSALQGLLGQS